MSKIKLCGLSRSCDIEEANRLQPEYIGFIFAKGSRRYVTPEQARALKQQLSPAIQAVGVFVNEEPEIIAALLREGVIDVAQLHGQEDADYIRRLRALTDRPIIQAFRMRGEEDAAAARRSPADYILLDSAVGGSGTVFDWSWLRSLDRPYFLAGGLDPENVGEACRRLQPYAVDVSSGIETDGKKDKIKMEAFVASVRKESKR